MAAASEQSLDLLGQFMVLTEDLSGNGNEVSVLLESISCNNVDSENGDSKTVNNGVNNRKRKIPVVSTNSNNSSSSSSRKTSCVSENDAYEEIANPSAALDKPEDSTAFKRMKNREAAARCRQKRKDLIESLQDQVSVLASEKKVLLGKVEELSVELKILKGVIGSGIRKEQETAFNKLEERMFVKQVSANTHIPADLLGDLGLNL